MLSAWSVRLENRGFAGTSMSEEGLEPRHADYDSVRLWLVGGRCRPVGHTVGHIRAIVLRNVWKMCAAAAQVFVPNTCVVADRAAFGRWADW